MPESSYKVTLNAGGSEGIGATCSVVSTLELGYISGPKDSTIATVAMHESSLRPTPLVSLRIGALVLFS